MVLNLRAQGLEEGDEHLRTLSCGARLTLVLLFVPADGKHNLRAAIP